MQRFWIDGPLPALNTLINAAKSRWGQRQYNQIKQSWHNTIGWQVLSQGVKPVEKASFNFMWVEKNRKRDLDNIAAGGRKLILDSLVDIGVLKNDGWKNVEGWTDSFSINKDRPGVWVEIIGG